MKLQSKYNVMKWASQFKEIDEKHECVVYVLCDPNTLRITYIGCSSSIVSRLCQHIYSSNGVKKQWLDSLKLKGQFPIVKFLYKGGSELCLNKETDFINYCYLHPERHPIINIQITKHLLQSNIAQKHIILHGSRAIINK